MIRAAGLLVLLGMSLTPPAIAGTESTKVSAGIVLW